MRTPRSLLALTALVALGLGAGCTDTPTALASARADTTALMNRTDHELLVAVLSKLTTLEARFDSATRYAQARFDSLRLAMPGGVISLAPAKLPRDSVSSTARLCWHVDFEASGALESSPGLEFSGQGGLGAYVFGNGAQIQVKPGGHLGAQLEVGPKAGITLESCTEGTSGNRQSGAVQSLLRDVLNSVTPDMLVTAAQGSFNMTGQSLQSALNAVTSYDPQSDLASLASGGDSALLNALPTLPAVGNVLRNPGPYLQTKLREAETFAMTKLGDLCTSFPSGTPFANAVQEGCDIATGQTPNALFHILDPLASLPKFVSSTCGAVNTMLAATVDIPAGTLAIPSFGISISADITTGSLGLGLPTSNIRVFPGFNATVPGYSSPRFQQPLFSGVPPAC